jgi:hypothetical protein
MGVTHLGNICRIRHRAGFTYGSPGAGFPGLAAVRSESAIYWRAGSHRASAAGKALGPDFLGSRGDNLPTRPEHGVVLARINPFGTTVDPTKFVASGLTADPAGNIDYNAIQLKLSIPWNGENLNLLTAKALIVGRVGKNR